MIHQGSTYVSGTLVSVALRSQSANWLWQRFRLSRPAEVSVHLLDEANPVTVVTLG